MMDETTSDPDDPAAAKHDRTALTWFGLGALIGTLAAAGLMMLSRAADAPSNAAVDMAAIREAARLGAQEALRETARDAQSAFAPAASSLPEPAAAVNMQEIQIRPANTRGAPDAPVTVIEYSDFQCPFCTRFSQQTYPKVVEQYVNTGKVRFSYKHFAFLGEGSVWAAQAAECAADQDRFTEYHDRLFAVQASGKAGDFSKEELIGLADTLKLDTNAFATCLNENKTLDRVTADRDEGQRLGVRGTPAFLINGQWLIGAQPFEAFQKVIDRALTGAK